MNKKKILYAEDDRLSRELVKERLEKEGFEVLVASNGKEACRIFQEEEGIAVVVRATMALKLRNISRALIRRCLLSFIHRTMKGIISSVLADTA